MSTCLFCKNDIPIGHMDKHGKGRCDAKVAKSKAPQTASRDQLAQLGAAVASQKMARERVAKELDATAVRFDRQADSIGNYELRRYYLDKARSARTEAAAIRAGKDDK